MSTSSLLSLTSLAWVAAFAATGDWHWAAAALSLALISLFLALGTWAETE